MSEYYNEHLQGDTGALKRALYKACGCKYLPEHIGIDPSLKDEMLPISAAIRNRLTLVRMMRVLDFD